MEMIFCPNCNKLTGYKRAIGFGTFFAVILTAGIWLLALPFYPKRCITCGLSKSESVPWYRTWRVFVLPLLLFCIGVAVFFPKTNRGEGPGQPTGTLKSANSSGVQDRTIADKPADLNNPADANKQKLPPPAQKRPVERSVPEKRPLPIRVDEVTVAPTPDGLHNVQMVKAVFPFSTIGQKDVHVWLMCNDVNSTCYPLRPGQLYWGTPIHPGEEGFSSCYPADNSSAFCTQIHGTYEGNEKLVVYVLGIVEGQEQ